jgi:hypothetical protein
MKRPALALTLLLSGSAACGGPSLHTRAGGAVSSLEIAPVDWNPTHAATGPVRAVADESELVTVFSNAGATVLVSGAVAARDSKNRGWISGAVIPGPDGVAEWLVGVTEDGRLYHLRGRTAFDDVTARYGFASTAIRAVTSLGAGFTGIMLKDEVATARGSEVTRWPAPGIHDLTGGGGLAAGTFVDAVVVFDFAHKTSWRFALPGVNQVAVDDSGRVYAATERSLYVSDGRQRLALLFDAGAPRLRGLVAAKSSVWLLDGDELALIDRDRLLETRGARLAADAKLAPSPSGDIWVISGGKLDRFTRARGIESAAPRWENEVAPVFSRACASCHLPDGVSGVDLSTSAHWLEKRDRIRERVMDERSMPPRGHALLDADRETIERWLAR